MSTYNQEVADLIQLNNFEINHAAGVLTRAFHDDPLWAYFFQDTASRPDKLFRSLRMLVNYAVKYGEVHATSPNFEGVSVWLPSEKAEMSPWQMIRSGALPVMLRMNWAENGRTMRYTDYASAIHKQCAPAPHWYLQFIGIDPLHQGQGFASRLLWPMLARLDAEQTLCFLETQNQENVAIYEHYGFRVVAAGMVLGTDIGHWAMLRPGSMEGE